MPSEALFTGVLMKRNIATVIALLSSLSVVSCGGGGSGGGDSESNPSEMGYYGAEAVASLIDNVAQMAYLVASGTENIPTRQDYPTTTGCINDEGQVSYVHDDVDSDDTLNAGDRYEVIFDNCQLDMLDWKFVSGTLKALVSQRVAESDSETYYITADYTGLSTLNGLPQPEATQLDIVYSLSPTLDRMVVTPGDKSFGYVYNTRKNFLFEDFRVERIQDKVAATWEVRVQGVVKNSRINGEFIVDPSSSLSGPFTQFPTSGELVYTRGSNSYQVEPDDGDNFNAFREFLLFKNGERVSEGVYDWYQMMPNFYAWNPFVGGRTRIDRETDFRLLYTVPYPLADAARQPRSPNHSITAQYDREIAEIINDETAYVPLRQGLPIIDAIVSLDGALLTLEPALQLQHGETYRVGNFLAIADSKGNQLSFPAFTFTTSDTVQAVIDPIAPFAVGGSAFTLSGANSSAESGIATLHWTQLSGETVNIDNPESAMVNVTPPIPQSPEVINIALDITDIEGEVDTESIDIVIFPDTESVALLYIDRAAYDLPDPVLRETYLVSTAAYSVDVDVISNEQIRIRFSNIDDAWSLRLKAPFDSRLTTGFYADAVQNNINAPERAVFWLTGDSPSCSSTTNFEVLDIEYTEEGELATLSLDFTQICNEGTPPLTGFVRLGVSP